MHKINIKEIIIFCEGPTEKAFISHFKKEFLDLFDTIKITPKVDKFLTGATTTKTLHKHRLRKAVDWAKVKKAKPKDVKIFYLLDNDEYSYIKHKDFKLHFVTKPCIEAEFCNLLNFKIPQNNKCNPYKDELKRKLESKNIKYQPVKFKSTWKELKKDNRIKNIPINDKNNHKLVVLDLMYKIKEIIDEHKSS